MALQEKSKNIEQYKEKIAENILQVEKPDQLLAASLNQLAKIGGFDLLEASFDGVQNLNPERKARKKIFLSEESRKGEREELKKTLELWAAVISSSEGISDMIDNCEASAEAAEQTLKKNLLQAVEATRGLEKAYRSVALFFKNTGSSKVKNISFMNAELEQLKDLDDTRFIDAIREELVQKYDRLDLRENYSLLV